MKINYLRLEGSVGVYIGQQTNSIEIDFQNSQSKIVTIQGINGSSKSTVLASLTPFATPTSMDERSAISYIREGHSGYKEIHYRLGNDQIIIKHYFKPNKESHSVKSYFQWNDQELNENGNVKSFLALVENHLGLSPEMMRLIRLGTNVNSFITLLPAERKKYLGGLIERIELYLKIYKKVNDDARVVKALIAANTTSLHNCHVTDLVVEQEKVQRLEEKIKSHEKNRDTLKLKIDRIENLERENKIEELQRKYREAEGSLLNFQQTEEKIIREGLSEVKVPSLIAELTQLKEKEIDLRSQISSYRIMIDTSMSRIDSLKAVVDKSTTQHDLQSLLTMIQDLQVALKNTPKEVKIFPVGNCRSQQINEMIMKLHSFNQISTMIHSFGHRVTSLYLDLKRGNKSIDDFIHSQTKRHLSALSDSSLRKLLADLYRDNYIIAPSCDEAFKLCPYYRLSTVINEYKNLAMDDLIDDEVLRYLKVVSLNIDTLLNELEILERIPLPAGFKEILKEKNFLSRLESRLSFFDLSELQAYLTRVKEHEIYLEQLERLSKYEHELQVYQTSGIDSQLQEIKSLEKEIENYRQKITTAESSLSLFYEKISQVEVKIALLSTYTENKKYLPIIMNTLETTQKILHPLESAASEKLEFRYQLQEEESMINSLRGELKELEQRIISYQRLSQENKHLTSIYHKLDLIMTSASTREGIPLVYMNSYLGKIQTLANSLLDIIYNGKLILGKFKITADEFEIPFLRNRIKGPDIRYASQSELPLITMALSFALAHSVSQKYNILLLDEIDAGLDQPNRAAFLKMLNRQMNELQTEQVFIISHNLFDMFPDTVIDVIKLSDVESSSPMHNIIYE